MAEFEFKEAQREAAPVFIGIEGESGSGKTYSALLLARGIVGPKGKIGVIDTEGKRSLMYADDPDIGGFLHMDFVAPYSSDRFRKAVHAARAAGVDVIVIDSASHEHEAEGGMLDY
ncbi:MAG TPA: ATP-binding protein, partial [Pyrinomonadaceae bacterium]|nr:ATP-binding protein [Pyrinomonadaceae bacterium]